MAPNEAGTFSNGRLGLVIFSALYTTFFAGAFFGYGPMALMLEEDGAFESKCAEDYQGEDPCEAQTLSLLNVQFIANLMPFLSPFLGYVSDAYGAPFLMKILAVAGSMGIALIVLASLSGIDQLYFPAFCGTGLCFVSTSVIIVQTGMVFPTETAQRRVISLLNGLLDAGSITYLILYQIYLAVDTTLVGVTSGYFVFGLVCFGGAIYFWSVVAASSQQAQDKEPSALDTSVTEPLRDDSAEDKVEMHAVVQEEEPTSAYTMVAQRAPMDQLKSQQFLLLVTFFGVHVARNNWTMTVARAYLASLGDDDVGNRYLTIFTGLSVASIVGLPFIDRLLATYGYHAGFQMVNALAILHGIIQVSSDDLNVQVAGFVVYSFYRCFTFATCFSFLPVFLGGQTIGRGAGLLAFSGAVSNLFNLGLAAWVVNRLDQDYFAVNLLYTLAIVPIIAVAYRIGTCIQREQFAAAEELVKSGHKVLSTEDDHQGVPPTVASSIISTAKEVETEYEC